MNIANGKHSTFRSIFYPGDCAVSVHVPDYQRAYSWEKKQTDLFLEDLVKYHDRSGYYFGHFIAEENGGHWEIVDGQQRLTTFVLFLMVCSVLSSPDALDTEASMIARFSTVSYDSDALETICRNLGGFLKEIGDFDEKHPPKDDELRRGLSLSGVFTRSQRRMVLALLRFHQAFREGRLKKEKIRDYIDVVMNAHCSHHLTGDKSVAVNIFGMHNTRGIPLSTLDIVKALLMKFVFDHGGKQREDIVQKIQAEFGQIYGMEEELAARSFRGEMTMEQLLRLHLRVVDDGTKRADHELKTPAQNANAEAIVAYVDRKLHLLDDRSTPRVDLIDGVSYALSLAREFKKSVRIVSEHLPRWDESDSLVGDVLILEREISCEFFLVVSRRFESAPGAANGRIGNSTLSLWEKLLFTRDLHVHYYNLRAHLRDNFPALFASIPAAESGLAALLIQYLSDGFRPDRTAGLQGLVRTHLNEFKEEILNDAFRSWWRDKMIYALYKFETSRDAVIRSVMKGTISVEHILPQGWESMPEYKECVNGIPEDQRSSVLESIERGINGIGNLLLITPSENTSLGNTHPAKKVYERYHAGGSYKVHHENREKWMSARNWPVLIRERGNQIMDFMLDELVYKLDESSDGFPISGPGAPRSTVVTVG